MEFASKLRWFLVVITMVIFLILVGWGLYSIARNLFNSNATNTTDTVIVDESLDYIGTARIYVDGRVVANSDHRSYSIDVSSGVVTMKVYSSYGQNVIKEQSYKNTSEAYTTFMNALASYNVPDRINGTTEEDDYQESGVCPTGQRYILELDNSIRRWSTSCSANQGTAGFSMSRVLTLFQRQVPDFNDLISGVRL